jgi:hypothetical protein
MADKKSQGKRSALHILVAVRELGIRIGGPTSVRREAIVDVGNAHDFADAENKAKVRAARQWHTNVICVQVTETRLAIPEEPVVLYDSAKVDQKDEAYSLQFDKANNVSPVYPFDATAPTFRGNA